MNVCPTTHHLQLYHYRILKQFPDIQIEMVYSETQAKDAIFDDPPIVAFQMK